MSDNLPEPLATAATMPQLVRAAAAAYGEAVAIRLNGETIPDAQASFRELDERSAALASGLVARGVGKGARVGFIAGNGPFFAVAFAAIGRIGAVAVPISTMIRANELVRVLRQSDVGGLIVQRRFLGNDYATRLTEALPALAESGPALRLAAAPFLRWVACEGEGLPESFSTLDDLVAEGAAIPTSFLAAIESEVHPTDQLVEIYTSGSMALPKGVKHDHGPMLFRARYLAGMLGATRGKEMAAYLPMFWVGGMMMALMPDWVAGATTVCSERTLSNSQVAMGSVLSAEDLAKTAGNPPWWGLGMSETLGPYSWGDVHRAPGHPVCAPMDHFAPGYEVRTADEAGNPVPEGTPGEVQLRGYAVTRGLHKIARDENFTPDGFYRTGDMGVWEGSRLHFVGRSGDMIKTAGSNVSPAEVEMELQQIDGVHSAYVVGIPDRERGQLVVAAIVPREGASLDFAAIEAELRKRLSSYKVPRAWLAIRRDEVPLL
ncbi:MAG: acyl--CoA ligase, partial [Sphingomonadales bacterium]|nr:acyl--CoA ligase [Sphingomonadales bacterium]